MRPTLHHRQQSVQAPQKSKMLEASNLQNASSLPMCSGCGTYITDDMKALQCDRCQSTDTWKCVDCLHLSPEVYDQLVSDVSCSLRWFCECCNKSVIASSSTSSTRNDDRVDSLISLVEKLMDKFESLGAKYHEEASTTLDAITKNTEKLVEKMNNMEKCCEIFPLLCLMCG